MFTGLFADSGIRRRWLVISAILHIAIVIFLIVGLPEREQPLLPPPPVIIDLVTVSDKTRTPTFAQKEIITKKVEKEAKPPPPPKAAKAESEPVVKPLKSTLKKQPIEKVAVPNTIVKKEIKPVEKPVTKPVKQAVKPPVAKPVKKVVEQPKPAEQKLPTEVKKTPPVKKAVQEPVKEPEKKVVKEEPKATPKDFSSLIRKSIDGTKPSQTSGAGQTAVAASRELSDVLTVSQMDAVRRHISRCWNIAAIQGARDLDKIVVKTQLTMNPDRTIKNFRITGGTGQYSPFYNRMVETIERLFQRPDCQTLPLPAGQYSQWQQFQLSFSLKDQLGY